MRMSLKGLLFSTALTAVAVGSVSSAEATPFGPATAALDVNGTPTVTSSTISLGVTSASLHAGTGSLVGTPYAGTGTGTISYSQTIGTIVTAGNNIPDLFTFNDKHGGSFVFNLTSVETVAFVSNSHAEDISLYFLGVMSDVNSNPAFALSGTSTSLSMTFNSTGGSAFSESGSLSNPPVTPIIPSPEPATMTVLGVGLLGLGVARRRKR